MFRSISVAADRCAVALFVSLLVFATVLLTHPEAVHAYRGLQTATLSGVHDSSGYFAHLTCFGTLTCVGLIVFRREAHRFVILGLIAHGTATEFSQRFIPGRTFDIADLGCNVAAVILLTAVVGATRRIFDRRPFSIDKATPSIAQS